MKVPFLLLKSIFPFLRQTTIEGQASNDYDGEEVTFYRKKEVTSGL